MYNVLEKQSDVKVCHAQVVYLKEVMNKTCAEIADITGYAVNTVRSYAKKFLDLLEWARSIFERQSRRNYDEIINSNGYNIKERLGEICYLFEFYNADNVLICSKVGTTTRTIRQRLIEELRSKTYKDMGITNAVVNRVYECGNLPAEGLESLIRSEYIKKYPKSFKKNDRFIGEKFDFELCDKIAEDYLN